MSAIPKTPFDVRINAREAFVRWRPYLGPTAERVKRFAEEYFDANGIEPSYNEVCEGCGIMTRGEVSRIMAGLERRGEVRREEGRRYERRTRLLNR
jgi:SOS-response transcriptional repressor LexA